MNHPDLNQYRYERKFFISDLTLHEIEALLRLNPAMFSEIYHLRFVNNIYFDSFDWKNYFDNVDGLHERMKFRIRWYGDLFGLINKPVLEIKIKNGFVGRKESFPLHPFHLNENFVLDRLTDSFQSDSIPASLRFELKTLNPTMLNRYHRKYFQSVDRKFRITIDSELEFYQIHAFNNSFQNRLIDKVSTILELKYEAKEDQDASVISNFFPFRMTKMSKYISGCENIYSG